MKTEKNRIDVLLVERGLCPSREKAQARILAGEVLAGGHPAKSAGQRVPVDIELTVKSQDKYVSRGGHKLEKALNTFNIDPAGKHALDIGASTGGFTDCLLQRGAASVAAVDVGYGQLAHSISIDPRVAVFERTNARAITREQFGRDFDIIVIDVSFISISKILPALAPLLAPGGVIIALVKPQFEAGPKKVGRGGVVKDPAVHMEVLQSAAGAAAQNNFIAEEITHSPIQGPAGNIEFLMLMRQPPGGECDPASPPQNIPAAVSAAHAEFAKP